MVGRAYPNLFSTSLRATTTFPAVGRAVASSASIRDSTEPMGGIFTIAFAKSTGRLLSDRHSMHGMPKTMPMIMQESAQMSKGVPYSAPKFVGSNDLLQTSGGLMYLRCTERRRQQR